MEKNQKIKVQLSIQKKLYRYKSGNTLCVIDLDQFDREEWITFELNINLSRIFRNINYQISTRNI